MKYILKILSKNILCSFFIIVNRFLFCIFFYGYSFVVRSILAQSQTRDVVSQSQYRLSTRT